MKLYAFWTPTLDELSVSYSGRFSPKKGSHDQFVRRLGGSRNLAGLSGGVLFAGKLPFVKFLCLSGMR